MKAYLAKLKEYGGTLGDAKKIHLAGSDRIVGISIYYGSEAIHSLTWSYKQSGIVKSTKPWGGEGGRCKEIQLRPNEYIVSLSGYFGSNGNHRVIKSLKLVTNLGTTHGPYGTQQGTSFQLAWRGNPIVGFHARCGAFLNAIGVYVMVDVNNFTPGNNNGGCKSQKKLKCRCGNSVWVRCGMPWYFKCQYGPCGRRIWGGCGQAVYHQCACDRLIWKGCSLPQNKRCRCGPAR